MADSRFRDRLALHYSRKPIADPVAYETTFERVKGHLLPADAFEGTPFDIVCAFTKKESKAAFAAAGLTTTDAADFGQDGRNRFLVATRA